MNAFPYLHVLDHPIAADRLRQMRDQTTDRERFARAMEHLSIILAVEATKRLATVPTLVQTPMERAPAVQLAKPVLLVPVLRAGLGILRGFQDLLPMASVAFFGARRDESTLRPTVYLDKIPRLNAETEVFLLDPMLATGHSVCATIARLREQGAGAITLVCCLAAPEGVAEVGKQFPGVQIIAGALDRELNEVGFILPGLGDAGDRQFGG